VVTRPILSNAALYFRQDGLINNSEIYLAVNEPDPNRPRISKGDNNAAVIATSDMSFTVRQQK